MAAPADHGLPGHGGKLGGGGLAALLAYARQQADLARVQKDGLTKRQHLERAAQQLRRRGRPVPKALRPLPMPPGCSLIWRAFTDLAARRQHSDMGSPQAIPYQEIKAYLELTRLPLHAGEIQAITELDDAVRSILAQQTRTVNRDDTDAADEDDD